MADMFDAGQPLPPKEWSWDADTDAFIAVLDDDDFMLHGVPKPNAAAAANDHPKASSEWRPVNESCKARIWLPSEAVESDRNWPANVAAFSSAMHYRYNDSSQQAKDFHLRNHITGRLQHLELDGFCNMKAWLPVEGVHQSRSADNAVTGTIFLQHNDAPCDNNAHNFNMRKQIAERHSHSELTGSCNTNVWLPALVAQQNTPADMATATSAIFLQNNTFSPCRKAQDCNTYENLHSSVFSECCKINALYPTETESSQPISSAETTPPEVCRCSNNEPASPKASDLRDQISEHVQHSGFDECWKIDSFLTAESVRSKKLAAVTTADPKPAVFNDVTRRDGSWKIQSLKPTETDRYQQSTSADIAAVPVFGDPLGRKSRDISDCYNENPLHSAPITPLSNDVIFGKGGRLKHPGNKLFRAECERLAPRFLEEPSTKVKRQLAVELVFFIFDQGGRFLIEDYKNKGTWKLAGLDLACKKARQLLADSKKKTDLRQRARGQRDSHSTQHKSD